LPLMSKLEAAHHILDHLVRLRRKDEGGNVKDERNAS